jgi:hypothetical protein
VTNYRKQLTAKAAWARMVSENRSLREKLGAIAELASGVNGNMRAEARLRKIREIAGTALAAEKRAA